ncbi:glycosyltransferase family 2 protein [Flavobacterium sp.]|uniref:glycosyltransferase family 2 protein n=1 Tax=Flavobacterium sp. TaxID=239 RepID=UPI003BC539AE
MNISGLVITFNEEKNIGECIDALFQVCDEVIVVDSNSTDNTVKIANEKGAKIIVQSFLGDGPQRIHGVPYCKYDWILNLDADEFLDSDSIKFIEKGSFFNASYDAYSFRVKNFLQEKVIDFAGWYPDYKIRFFNKKTATPSDDKVHQKIIATNIKKLNTHILHYGSHSFFQIIAKKNQYAQWNAEQLYDAGKTVSCFKPAINGLVSFIRCYFFKKGIINGIDGLTISLTQGYFSYIKYSNLYQIQKERKILK